MYNNAEIMLSCSKCSSKVMVSDMRYNDTGDFLICLSCYDKEHSSTKELPSLARERRTSFDVMEANLGRVTYQCPSCTYTFSRKADPHYNGTCPFCSRKGCKEKGASPVEKKPEIDRNNFFDVDSFVE